MEMIGERLVQRRALDPSSTTLDPSSTTLALAGPSMIGVRDVDELDGATSVRDTDATELTSVEVYLRITGLAWAPERGISMEIPQRGRPSYGATSPAAGFSLSAPALDRLLAARWDQTRALGGRVNLWCSSPLTGSSRHAKHPLPARTRVQERDPRGHSSVGRASHWQCEGQGFKSLCLQAKTGS